jgi:hypothetical protein
MQVIRHEAEVVARGSMTVLEQLVLYVNVAPGLVHP